MSFEDQYQQSSKTFSKNDLEIPEKMRQKLFFLKASIENCDKLEIDIDPSIYPQLDEDELEALFKLPVQTQKQMFCSIMKSLDNENTQQEITGNLHIKGELLGLWKQKAIKLSLSQNRLYVPRSESKEGFVELDLSHYQLLWQGEKKGMGTYYCFSIEASNPQIFDHYKHLVLGSDDAAYARQWFGYFKQAFEQVLRRQQKRRNSFGNETNNNGGNPLMQRLKPRSSTILTTPQKPLSEYKQKEIIKEVNEEETVIENPHYNLRRNSGKTEKQQQQPSSWISNDQQIDLKVSQEIVINGHQFQQNHSQSDSSSELPKILDQLLYQKFHDLSSLTDWNGYQICHQSKKLHILRSTTNNNMFKGMMLLSAEVVDIADTLFDVYKTKGWNAIVKDQIVVHKSENGNQKWYAIMEKRGFRFETTEVSYVRYMDRRNDDVVILERSVKGEKGFHKSKIEFNVIRIVKRADQTMMFFHSCQDQRTIWGSNTLEVLKQYEHLEKYLRLTKLIQTVIK